MPSKKSKDNTNNEEKTVGNPTAEEKQVLADEVENNTSSDTADPGEENETQAADPIAELESSLNAEKDKYLRLFAEFENYKKRTAKERLDLYKTANQEVLQALIPILDDFDRASNQKDTDSASIAKGFKLIHSKLSDTLKANGLKPIETKKGEAFDAEIHEAITQIPVENEKEKGKIVDIIEKGYQLGDRIIRYPKVVVGQ